jgi:D-methionine transport system permease protein
MLIPFTRFIVETMLGPKAALPALIISATPFFARVVHIALFEVSNDTIEAARSMGASFKHLMYVIFKEALPALVSGYTLTLVTLIGFMSAAAVIGAGGLAFLA